MRVVTAPRIPRTAILPLLVATAALPVARAAPGDMDGDRGFDLQDYAFLRPCVLGPGQSLTSACSSARFDADLDADLTDFAGFQSVFGESCASVVSNDACHCSIDIADGSSAYSNSLVAYASSSYSIHDDNDLFLFGSFSFCDLL